MERKGKQLKRHIISMRISEEEWASLHEVMKDMHFRRVSDVMREGMRLVSELPHGNQPEMQQPQL